MRVPLLLLRAGFVTLAASVLVPVLAMPAAAHGRGSDATNWDSRVTETPGIPGVSWEVHGGDELLELVSVEQEVTVLGYSGEPYVRVGPTGVHENTSSPATYLNEDRYRTDLPPGASADPDADPSWERVSDGPSYAWHDHRVHMMSTALPREVEADPGTSRLVQEWSVPVVPSEGSETVVRGELHWVPGPSPWPWLALGIVAVLPALLGVVRRDSSAEALARPAAVVLGSVALLNLSHVIDDIAAMPLPLSTIVLSVSQTLLFLLIGALGAVKAWHGGDGAFTALAVGSAAVLVGQGVLYLSVLSASQLTTVFPHGVGRFIVAASMAQALTVGPVAVLGTRRMVPDEEAADIAHAASA